MKKQLSKSHHIRLAKIRKAAIKQSKEIEAMKKYPKAIVNQARQGDVFLIRDDDQAGEQEPREGGDVILAHGEVTGHAHRIKNRSARTFNDRKRNRRYMRSNVAVNLTHEEHGTITIAPGNYRVVIQRVWTDAEESLNVAD